MLALAVIAQAVKDWRRGSRGARSWLITVGLDWLDGCGMNIDPDYWQMWVLSGCMRRYMREAMANDKQAELRLEDKEDGTNED